MMTKQGKRGSPGLTVTALSIALFWLGGLFPGVASATIMTTQIDLNDFFADPTVTVAVDGSSALLEEDAALSPVLLSNDPGLGDPNVIFPGPGTSLVFDFDFTEAVANDDEFGAFVLDALTGLSLGSAFEFFTAASSAGTVSFDLSSLVGVILGLQFQLSALPGDINLDSSVTVSNVRLETTMAPMPLPSSLALAILGMFALALQYRARVKDK